MEASTFLKRTLALLLLVFTPFAQARDEGLEIQFGMAALEEGDDRYRAGGLLHVAWNPYAARYYFFEYDFGPVANGLHLLELTRSFVLPGFQALFGRVGVAAALDHTRIHYDSSSDADFNRNEYEWNGGLVFGVYWSPDTRGGPLRFQFAWDSAVFPAGVNGGILLATGRKHTLSLSAGMSL